MLAIEARGLVKRYGQVSAVAGVDLDVRQGEIVGLVGADGAGKTTTLQILSTLRSPSGGGAAVLGMDVVTESEAVKEKIGYMAERFALYPTLTVGENLDFFARLRGVPQQASESRQRELLTFSRLEPFRDRRAEDLSGGMKKKLALCCCLIHQPAVLLLDEPTTGVDPISRRDFWQMLSRSLAQGISVLVSTPYMDEAERFSRVFLIHQGRIVGADTPGKLRGSLSGELLEIKAEPAAAAVSCVKKLPYVTNAHIYGDSVHLVVDGAERRLPEVRRVLYESGVKIHDVRRIAPGLEDVFVTVLAGEQAQQVHPGHLPGADGESVTRPHVPDGPAIAVSGLTRRFGDFTAVDRVTFEISPGEIFGLLGPNGSGKTTTIRMMCGLLPPTSGGAMVLGQDMTTSSHRARSMMGYMSQRFSLFPDLTVAETIDFYAGMYGLSRSMLKERKAWVLEMSGLCGKEGLAAKDLSGGWRQRLALGCAIIHRPEVIFLDEPTSGVDPLSRRFFWELIQELVAGGATVFITTHYMDEAEHCHRLGLMHLGRLIALGSARELKATARGDLLQVDTADFSKALDLLSGSPVFRQVSFFGSALHAVVDSAEEGSRVGRALLEGGGIPVHGIRHIPFSMEDVFISLVEAQEASGGGLAAVPAAGGAG